MASEVLVPLGIVAAVAAVAFFVALRRPVIFRMAVRNALRRRRQAIVVVAGLMVGTAIIAGSLATGDSLAFTIRQGAFDGLGIADEFVRVEGNLAFPSYVYDELAADGAVRDATFALSPLLFEEASAGNPRTKQNAPFVTVVGFDPVLDAPFGDFHLASGGTTSGADLARDELYVLETVAEELALVAGDTVTLRYAVTPPPLLPTLYEFQGQVTADAGGCLPDGAPVVPGAPALPPCAPGADPAGNATFTVSVPDNTARLFAALFWFGPAGPVTDLDPVLTSPSGVAVANGNGSPAAPDVPAFLNVTPVEGERWVEPGEWTFTVRAKTAANQPFGATVVVLEETYDVARFRNATSALQGAGFDPEAFADFAGGADARKADFTVRGIVAATGKGDFLLGSNVFMRLDRAQELFEQPDRITIIQVSNTGDVENGAADTARVTPVIESALTRIRDAHPNEPALRQLMVEGVKEGWLEGADEAGTVFKQFLTTIGSFTIVAGIMLIVNIFVMLAEERKSELGMARAVGLKRRQLLLLFGLEGFLYALVAAAVGVFLGLGLSWGLIRGFNAIIASSSQAALTTFPFHPEPSSLAWAFASGFLLTLATVALASRKVSQLNVVRAIRKQEEPRLPATGRIVWTGAGLAALGLAGSAYAAFASSLPWIVLAPCLVAIGASMVLTRWFRARYVYPIAGGFVAAYATWTIFAFTPSEALLEQLMGPVRGVIIVIAIVLIVVNTPWLVPLTKRALSRVRSLVAVVPPGIAYPLEKKTRTGLTIAMFSLVILVIVAFSIFAATFSVDLAAQSGGYDVEGDSTIAVADLNAYYLDNLAPNGTADPFVDVARWDTLRYARAFGGEAITINDQDVNYQGPPIDYFYSFDSDFVLNNEYELESRSAAYASDEAVYRAVLDDPTLVIISAIYDFDQAGQPGAHGVDSKLTLTTGGDPVDFTIIGVQKQFYLGGVWMHPNVLDANFQRVRGEYLFTLNEGADPREVARGIEAAFEDLGMDAVSLEEAAAEQLEASRRFFTLFQLFLAFGLVVGIASMGIVTTRSVIERRQEIGMLRAIGYNQRAILKMVLVEILFTTSIGVLIGSAIGFLISYGVVVSSDTAESLGIQYTVPWLNIIGILALTYAATLAATFVPARAASRTPPAEAVRYVE